MIVTNDLQAKIMRLWGNPAATELSPRAMRDAIDRVWHIITMEMSIVSPSYFAAFSDSFTIDEDSQSATLPIVDLAVPVALEYATSADSATEVGWTQIDTVQVENWDYVKSENSPRALFYSSPGGLAVKINFAPGNSLFRVRYIADASVSGVGSRAHIELPAFFSPMFEKGAAAECGDMIVTDRPELLAEIPSKKMQFKQEFLMYLDRFKGWVRSSRADKGIQSRTPSNASRRNNLRRRRYLD